MQGLYPLQLVEVHLFLYDILYSVLLSKLPLIKEEIFFIQSPDVPAILIRTMVDEKELTLVFLHPLRAALALRAYNRAVA